MDAIPVYSHRLYDLYVVGTLEYVRAISPNAYLPDSWRDNMKPKQPHENRKILARALRSDKYPRTTSQLAGGESEEKLSYCCMGVAGVLLAEAMPESFAWRVVKEGDRYPGVTYHGEFLISANNYPSAGCLPTVASQHLFGYEDRAQDAFVDMNDEGVPWDVMADLLELPDDELSAFVDWYHEEEVRDPEAYLKEHRAPVA